MANIKSQKKRIKTNEKRRLRNKAVRSALKTSEKRFRIALESGDNESAASAMSAASQALDKAASKGVVHPNSAANRKSKMSRRLNAAG